MVEIRAPPCPCATASSCGTPPVTCTPTAAHAAAVQCRRWRSSAPAITSRSTNARSFFPRKERASTAPISLVFEMTGLVAAVIRGFEGNWKIKILFMKQVFTRLQTTDMRSLFQLRAHAADAPSFVSPCVWTRHRQPHIFFLSFPDAPAQATQIHR